MENGGKAFNNGNGAKDKILRNAQNYLSRSEINEKNKEIITSFVNYLAADDLTKDRQSKYIYTCARLSQKINNRVFSTFTKKDIENIVAEINNSDFSEWTKRDYRIVLKRLMKFIREREGNVFLKGQYPLEVSWLSSTMKKTRKKLPKELLTIDDIKKLADFTLNLRDKAFIFFLYESGARIGEILNIKLSDIEFDEYGARVTLFGKTGSRVIRVIASAPAISNWITHHPTFDGRNKDVWLFCSLNRPAPGLQAEYFYFNKLLRVAKKRAEFNKPVNPHHFRHSRATELAKKLTEAQLCSYMGWKIGSKEAATYVHLSGRDTDKAILALHGMVKEDQEQENFTPIECPRCRIKNDPGAKFCRGCSLGLNEKSILEYDKIMKDGTALAVESMQKQIDSLKTALTYIFEKQPDIIYEYQQQKQIKKQRGYFHKNDEINAATNPGKK
jgi:integrase/recombinase XerD